MITKDQKEPVMAVVGNLAEPVPLLDLGKKLSVPQDLMIEELSLRNNRGSLLFQKRQRRVERFTFEFEASQPGAVNGPEGQHHPAEGQDFSASPGGQDDAQAAAAPPRRARSPSALAPGYSEPLKAVPPEKFNHTSIPKGYRCPWQAFVSPGEFRGDGRSHAPRVRDLRDFNKTPVPFGGLLTGTPFVPEPFSGLELLRLRPNFNRVAQGWIRKLPETEEL
ncbi:myozenin-3 [Thomomys bottae]